MRIKLTQRLRRGALALIAMALTLGVAIPGLMGTAAAAQVNDRYIEMSDSTGDATGVSYQVGFTGSSTSGTVKGIVVDFCSNSPVIGDSCTAPTGLSLAGVTVNTGTSPDTGLTGTWTVGGTDSTLELTNATGTSLTSTAVVFTISGVTNPTGDNTPFYARILTYANASGTNSPADYSAGSEGTYIDYGGVALSTGSVISITAKVMETLTFCVSKIDLTSSTCTSASSPALTIGHTVGTNTILSSDQVDTVDAYTQTSTNAQSGVIVRMKDTSSATCGGLSSDNGSTCGIPAVNASCTGTCAAQTITAGTAGFGMCLAPGTATTGSTTAEAPYNGSGCTTYGLDDATTTKVTSTYGSPIFESSSPMNKANDALAFAATADLTTPAGIYTGDYALIATGTF